MKMAFVVRATGACVIVGCAWWVFAGCGDTTENTYVQQNCPPGSVVGQDGSCLLPEGGTGGATGGSGGGEGGAGGQDASAGSGGTASGGEGGAGGSSAGGSSGASGEAGAAGEAGAGGAAGAGAAAGAGGIAGAAGAGGFGANGLDPRLVPALPDGQACTVIGQAFAAECGNSGLGRACRFFSSTEGRCEESGDCYTGGWCEDDPCVVNLDCWVWDVCFDGTCRPMCKLNGDDCEVTETCLDVGHFAYGVCVP